ncbi:MAG: DUF4387 domain-containing protein [Desulfurococcales archaeon]|nr:DUF4387 domain-containing protein [Desulfurococcales archaeon]
MARLYDVAVALRSKNAGPFLLTIDIILPSRECMERVAEVLTPARVADLYNVPLDRVVSVVKVPWANAVKIVLRRETPAGEPGDRDVYGAQQHAPLIGLEVEGC